VTEASARLVAEGAHEDEAHEGEEQPRRPTTTTRARSMPRSRAMSTEPSTASSTPSTC
jgi:hypothetical protein